jgi:hypothetical protein
MLWRRLKNLWRLSDIDDKTLLFYKGVPTTKKEVLEAKLPEKPAKIIQL